MRKIISSKKRLVVVLMAASLTFSGCSVATEENQSKNTDDVSTTESSSESEDFNKVDSSLKETTSFIAAPEEESKADSITDSPVASSTSAESENSKADSSDSDYLSYMSVRCSDKSMIVTTFYNEDGSENVSPDSSDAVTDTNLVLLANDNGIVNRDIKMVMCFSYYDDTNTTVTSYNKRFIFVLKGAGDCDIYFHYASPGENTLEKLQDYRQNPTGKYSKEFANCNGIAESITINNEDVVDNQVSYLNYCNEGGRFAECLIVDQAGNTTAFDASISLAESYMSQGDFTPDSRHQVGFVIEPNLFPEDIEAISGSLTPLPVERLINYQYGEQLADSDASTTTETSD